MTMQDNRLILRVTPAKAGIQVKPHLNQLPELFEKLQLKTVKIRKSMKKILMILLILIISVSFSSFDVHAHRVTIFAWVDGDIVHTQSKFGGGKMVNNGEVSVFDPEGNLLLKGNTDENGEFSFGVPKKTSLRIELNAGMGHQNEWTVKAEEMESVQENNLVISDQPEDSNNVLQKRSELLIETGLTREEIEQAVEQAMEKKLKPVMQMLSDLRNPGPRITDILGGIGYIIGLVGSGAYFKNRKKNGL
jgi:nickel transport protein